MKADVEGFLIFMCFWVVVFVIAFAIITIKDRVETAFGIRKNQEAWDEYSKDMTYPERDSCFMDWLERRKLETGNKFYYIPAEFHTPPKFFECYVNGTHYRGTLDEVSKQTRIPVDMLKQFEENRFAIQLEIPNN